jgi:hypothetical protein
MDGWMDRMDGRMDSHGNATWRLSRVALRDYNNNNSSVNSSSAPRYYRIRNKDDELSTLFAGIFSRSYIYTVSRQRRGAGIGELRQLGYDVDRQRRGRTDETSQHKRGSLQSFV